MSACVFVCVPDIRLLSGINFRLKTSYLGMAFPIEGKSHFSNWNKPIGRLVAKFRVRYQKCLRV